MYQPIMWVVRLLEDWYRPDFVKISRLKGSKSKEIGRLKHLAVLGGNYIYNKFKRTKKKWIYRWICKTIIGKKNIYPSYICESYTNPNPIIMASWIFFLGEQRGKQSDTFPPKSEKFNSFSLHWTWEAAKLRSEALFRFKHDHCFHVIGDGHQPKNIVTYKVPPLKVGWPFFQYKELMDPGTYAHQEVCVSKAHATFQRVLHCAWIPEKPIPSPKAVQTVDEEKTCLPSTLPLFFFGEVTYPFPNHFNRCLVLFQKWDILVPWWLFSHSFFCSPLPMSRGS